MSHFGSCGEPNCPAVPAESFYEPLGEDRFRATGHTVGPWEEGSQHGGPPAALLTRAIEMTSPSWPATTARIAFDILRPVPVAEVTVRSRLLRPGRSVELVEAELAVDGRTTMQARGWRIRRADLELPGRQDHVGEEFDEVPNFPSEQSPPRPGWAGGYLDAIEWRYLGSVTREMGPATVWARMKFPLLPDEEPSGLQRVVTIADSGNGVSSVLPLEDWLFINTELTVHLTAPPRGEWICLQARSHLDPDGFGLATSKLFDRERLVARGSQALYVSRRRTT